MGIVDWVVLVVVIAGIVIALLAGTGTAAIGREPATTAPPSQLARCSMIPPPASGCAFGTTRAQGNANTVPSKPLLRSEIAPGQHGAFGSRRYDPRLPSMVSRMTSAGPACRAVSSIMWSATHRRLW
jgi:hypothetical protein